MPCIHVHHPSPSSSLFKTKTCERKKQSQCVPTAANSAEMCEILLKTDLRNSTRILLHQKMAKSRLAVTFLLFFFRETKQNQQQTISGTHEQKHKSKQPLSYFCFLSFMAFAWIPFVSTVTGSSYLCKRFIGRSLVVFFFFPVHINFGIEQNKCCHRKLGLGCYCVRVAGVFICLQIR